MASITETTPTRTFTYHAVLDNHSVTRDYAYSTGELYAPGTAWDGQTETIVLTDSSAFKDAERSNYLIDDGHTVRAFYVAGWNQERTALYLQPFPTNHAGVDGRPVDFGTWALGPRRTYHLKVIWGGELQPTYEQHQIDRVATSGADVFALKLETRGAGENSAETKWLNISPAQLAQIRTILGEDA